jgi:hypothetical protein
VRQLVDHVSAAQPASIQTKLTVGPAGDKYEQEADRVAKQVTSTPSQAVASAQRAAEEDELQAKRLQRSAEEEEPLQAKRIQRAKLEEESKATASPSKGTEEDKEVKRIRVQRMGPEEEEPLQGKRLQRSGPEEELQMRRVQRVGGDPASMEGGDAAPEFESSVQTAAGKGNPLPESVRTEMEAAFGRDFGGVRVHADGQANALNRQVQALAFTTGPDIFFREGQYAPGSATGKEVLAHELTHVVQQGAASAKPAKTATRKRESERGA